MTQKYRIGLDMGANSIGWCALALNGKGEPCGVLDAGVRILTPNEEAGRDPQSKQSLAADRRDARAARKRRDRFLMRQKRLMKLLVDAGLMPAEKDERKDLEALDPYWLRAAALDQPLAPYELGRALFHLNQRRGFKSNRIADASDNDKGAVKTGTDALQSALETAGARTLGEFLARRHGRNKDGQRLVNGNGVGAPQPVRFRPTAKGAKNFYEFYPTRAMLEDELMKIWEGQAPHHPQLTEGLLANLKRTIIEQRPLKKPIVGRCTLRPDEDIREIHGLELDYGERAPKAHPLFQRFRILQDVSQLRVVRPGQRERPITCQERDVLVAKLMQGGATAGEFEKLRKAAKLSDDARFNYELAERKGFQPDQTAVKLSAKKCFGKRWHSFPRARQIEIVEKLLGLEDEAELTAWLQDEFELSAKEAQAISEARLPQSHGNFGRGVLADLIAVMETGETIDPETGEVLDRPVRYDEAVKMLDKHHSDFRPEEKIARLPYYGELMVRHVISKPTAPEGSQERIGRVPNPTVHIGLNQLRKIVNALIETYGVPDSISIELARELKLNKKRKEEISRENRENEKKNDARRAALAELQVAETPDARLRLRLFDELPADEKVCIYSGETLSMAGLFDSTVDIDHILPYSKTLDDSFMNKVLCTRQANREKGNRAPEHVTQWRGERLREIAERAERLFRKKAWRFAPGAMERIEDNGGFLARQLIDTQHMSRLAKAYLEHVCHDVVTPPGRLTAMLRGRWGLNSLLPDHNYTTTGDEKNRKNHKHHTVDAFVVACTSRALLQRMATASATAEDQNLDRLYPKDGLPIPFEGYREALDTRLQQMIVSHKPDHGLPPGAQDNVHVTSGQLLKDGAFGLVAEEIDGKPYNLVSRKPIAALTSGEIGRVRDAGLRSQLQQVEYDAGQSGEKLADALARFGETHNIRRVRILETIKDIRVVRHGSGFEKAHQPHGNHRIEIFELTNGKWAGEGISMIDANTPGYKPSWQQEHSGAKLIMRVHKGDLIEADFKDGPVVFRVYQLDQSADRLKLAPHDAAGSIQQRHNDPNDLLRWKMASYTTLQSAGARRVRIDVLGRKTYPKDRP